MKTLIVGLLLLAACGDPTAPGIACESEKRADLAARFGTDFSPTDPLLRQDQWTFSFPDGSVTVIDWAPNCTKTVH